MTDLPPTSDRPAELVLACVIDDLGTGGAQRLVSVMARHLAGRPVRLVVISLGRRAEEREVLTGLGVETHVLDAPRLTSPRRFRRLRSLLRDIDPDVVHTHLLASHVVAGLAARLSGIPVVATLHNVDPHPRFAGTWKRVAETFCLRFLSSRVIAVGPEVGASNASRLGGRAIDVLANPLSTNGREGGHGAGPAARPDSRAACRSRLESLIGSTPDSIHFLTVGRLASEKGWPEFLEVFDRLRRLHPAVRLISVGDGPCAEPVAAEIARRGLGGHVHLTGRSDEVRDFYLGSDVFVLNSVVEGLPMALLEAMEAGLPVVSTDVGDVGVATAHGVASLVPAGDIDAMVDALGGAVERIASLKAEALASRDRVRERFDPDRWTGDLVDLYRETIDGPPEGGLHVVEMVDDLNAGGAQALLAIRARNARRMGYRIDVVSLGAATSVSNALSEHVAGIHHFPSRHVFDRRRILAIRALLRRLRPDVVHTHLRTSNIVGTLCGRLAGVPVVGVLHNVFPELGLAHARRDWAEKWALRLGAARVVAVGPGVALTHRPRLGDKLVTAIPNPVELPSDTVDSDERRRLARRSSVLPFDAGDARVVLVVARLTQVKGTPDALDVLERLLPRFAGLKLVIAGEGELHERLSERVATSGLQESVFLLGRSEHVRELMAASDVLLLASHVEGLPLVLLEAMSMHLPIVATRVGDVPWLLGGGDFGALVDPGDVDGIAAAVERTLLLPEEERRALTDRAFRRARETFSVDAWLRAVDRELRLASGTAHSREASRLPPALVDGDEDSSKDSPGKLH